MQIRNPQLRGLGLFLLLLLGCSQAAAPPTLFPYRARGWNKIPTIVVLGQEGDWRNQLVNDAVDFWNQQLAEVGSGFRLGPVRFVSEILPANELATLSQAMLDGERAKVRIPTRRLSLFAKDIAKETKAQSDSAIIKSPWICMKPDGGPTSALTPGLSGSQTSVATSWPMSWAMRLDLGITMTRVSSCAVDPRLVVQTVFAPTRSGFFL